MNAPPTQPPTPPVPRWQAALAALSLAIFSAVVLLPIAAFLLLLWAGILGIVSGWTLDTIGVRQERELRDAVAIASALLGSAGFVALIGAIAAGAQKLGIGRKKTPPAPPPGIYYTPPIPASTPRPSWTQRLFRHPWLSLGGFALFVDGCVVPFQAARLIALQPAVLGAFVIAGASLLFLLAVVLSGRGYWAWMRYLWAGVRRSGFFAGLVTAGSLGVTVLALLVGHALGQAASAISEPETARALAACKGSAGDCSREILQAAIGGKPRQLAPARAGDGSGPPEPPTSFEECVEEIHRQPPYGRSARAEGISIAFNFTRDMDVAEDIVQETVVSVCFESERVTNIRPYFIQSIKYAAGKELRQGRKMCPLDPNDPPPLPEACFQDGPIADLIRQERREKAVRDSLCNLPPDQRKVIVMHLWNDLPHAEIARRLGMTVEAARQRYSRAVRTLEEQFKQRCQ